MKKLFTTVANYKKNFFIFKQVLLNGLNPMNEQQKTTKCKNKKKTFQLQNTIH